MRLAASLSLLSLVSMVVMTSAVLLVSNAYLNQYLYENNSRLLRLELSEIKSAITQKLLESGVRAAVRESQRRHKDLLTSDYTSSQLYVIDALGSRVIFHSQYEFSDTITDDYLEAILSKQAGNEEFYLNDQARYAEFDWIQPQDWIVVLSISKDELLAQKYSLFRNLSATVCFGFLIGILFFVVFGRLVIRDLSKSILCVDDLKVGKLNSRILQISAVEELAQLQRGINAMGEKIEQRTLESSRAAQEISLLNSGLENQNLELVQITERLGLALEVSGVAVWDWNIAQGTFDWDDRMFALYGIAVAENFTDGYRVWIDALHPADKDQEVSALNDFLLGTKFYRRLFRIKLPTGEIRYIKAAGRLYRDGQGNPARMLGTNMDVTEQMQAEEELRLAASVYVNSSEGILITNDEGKILVANPAYRRMTGFTEDELLGEFCYSLWAEENPCAFFAKLQDSIRSHGHWNGEIYNRRKDGSGYFTLVSIDAIKDKRGEVVRYASIYHDITEIKAKDEYIRHLAYHDALTNLPNRELLKERIDQALARAERSGKKVALCLLDLDRFKSINDALGHDVGDQLLVEISRRLLSIVRKTDTVARMGGDEFVLLMEDLASEDQCITVMQKVLDTITTNMQLASRTINVQASAGITFYPEHGADSDTLMKYADTAMYAAKKQGSGHYRFFSLDMLEKAEQDLWLEMALRDAIDKNELEVYYQPKIVLDTGKFCSMEALLRWSHAERGKIPPSAFIPIAESSGLIFSLGQWVLDTTCQQILDWQDNPSLASVPVAINVSARQFNQQGFASNLIATVEASGVSPSLVEIEVTETALMEQADTAATMIAELRQYGFSIAQDDFGTGYSSMSYLRRLPIDVLKIDQSFVFDMLNNATDLEVVKTIIDLARSLNIGTIAEGIESHAQALKLRQLGCQIGQGFYYARPMNAEQLTKWALDYGSAELR